ncbi:hypothetical protein [Pseudomonas anguilliseptica]|uniref:phage head morphogenesis protein n=1 Tax=Pseudomonas anguilliseptica TaxID=53406 RepID=UPI000A972F62|nr:hypothetical protein [Pseudomonas anguilliseptica]
MAKAPTPADLQAIFGLEPEKAIAYLAAKGYAITWNWQEMLDQAHDQAFTVAKAMRLDLLSDIRDALETALQDGQTLKQFIEQLQPVLEAQGWWGKQVIVDGAGNAELVQLGSPRRHPPVLALCGHPRRSYPAQSSRAEWQGVSP